MPYFAVSLSYKDTVFEKQQKCLIGFFMPHDAIYSLRTAYLLNIWFFAPKIAYHDMMLIFGNKIQI